MPRGHKVLSCPFLTTEVEQAKVYGIISEAGRSETPLKEIMIWASKLLMRTIPLLQVGVQLKVHSGAQTNLLNLN